MKLTHHRHSGISSLDAAAWNALAGDSPFLRHEFLAALEHSGCVGGDTSWEPNHLTVIGSGGELLGALPLYLKHDSRGEFVFDWGWANAYAQAGLSYYPKLVCAVPFTPATGQRLMVGVQADFSAVAVKLLNAARELGNELGASSLHILFPTEAERSYLAAEGLLTRKGYQFHWSNDSYRSFDDFLGRFNSAKRKKVKRERRRISEARILFEHLNANELSLEDWDAVFGFYSRTFLRRGRAPYLNREFFAEITKTMPENLIVILARFKGQPIAAAICFRSNDTLYGRYWGSLADFHSLHFETCYYQGIDYCIREGLSHYEPGTQGEHKISRGFSPTTTWSNHWIIDPAFGDAVADFLDREREHVEADMDELTTHVPYRRDLQCSTPSQ